MRLGVDDLTGPVSQPGIRFAPGGVIPLEFHAGGDSDSACLRCFVSRGQSQPFGPEIRNSAFKISTRDPHP
jgi:hypothetical protein